MTRMTDEEYVAADATKCPYCRSNELDWNSTDGSGAMLYQDVKCLSCGKDWTDVYRLEGYAPNMID